MSLAVKLRAQGHGVGFNFEISLSVNGHRCKPPLPEQEIRGIAEWAGKLPAIENHIDLEKNDDARKSDPTIIINRHSLVEDDGQPNMLEVFKGCLTYMAALGEELREIQSRQDAGGRG